MDNSTAIELKNVRKTFTIKHEKKDSIYEYVTSFLGSKVHNEELVVLNDISFSVNKGEMLGIVGFNGSGKTTLLRIISGILLPDSGIVNNNGKITPLLQLGTGFNGELTAKDNIIIYGTILGFQKKEIIQKIEKIAKFAELETFLDTKLKNFSAGMNARLAFSTAMEVDPDILLVDEILSVGDISFQQKSISAFMEFKKKGKTIVLVSHDIRQVKTLCDKVLWLHNGTIMAHGNSSDVVDKYFQFSTNPPKKEL